MKKIYLALLGILFIHPATFISAEDDDAILLEDEGIKPANDESWVHPEEGPQQLKKESVEHQTRERRAFKKRHSKGKFAKHRPHQQSKKIKSHHKFNSKRVASRDSKNFQRGRKPHSGHRRSRGKR